MENWPELNSEIDGPDGYKYGKLVTAIDWAAGKVIEGLTWCVVSLFLLIFDVLKSIGLFVVDMIKKTIDQVRSIVIKVLTYAVMIGLLIMFLTALIANDFSVGKTFSWDGVKVVYYTYK